MGPPVESVAKLTKSQLILEKDEVLAAFDKSASVFDRRIVSAGTRLAAVATARQLIAFRLTRIGVGLLLFWFGCANLRPPGVSRLTHVKGREHVPCLPSNYDGAPC